MKIAIYQDINQMKIKNILMKSVSKKDNEYYSNTHMKQVTLFKSSKISKVVYSCMKRKISFKVWIKQSFSITSACI